MCGFSSSFIFNFDACYLLLLSFLLFFVIEKYVLWNLMTFWNTANYNRISYLCQPAVDATIRDCGISFDDYTTSFTLHTLSHSLPLYPSPIYDCAILKLLFFITPLNNACFMLLFHFTTSWFVLALKALPSTFIALKLCFHVGQYADEISITFFMKMYFSRKIKNEYFSLLSWQRYS